MAGEIEQGTGRGNVAPFAPMIHVRDPDPRPRTLALGMTKMTAFIRPSCKASAIFAVETNSMSPTCTATCPDPRTFFRGTPRASRTVPRARAIPTGYRLLSEMPPIRTAIAAAPNITMGNAVGSNGVPMKARRIKRGGAMPKRVARTFVAPMAGERCTRFRASSSASVSGLSKTVSNGSICGGTGGGGGAGVPAGAG